MNRANYILKRLLAGIPVIFGVLTITFLMSRAMPGDPVRALLTVAQVRISPEIYANMARQLGLDQPLIVQYFRYLSDIFSGNWGKSVAYAPGSPVWDLILYRLPRTIDLAFFSIFIATYFGIKIGTISAAHRNEARDVIFRVLGLIGVAFPVFLLGMIFQYYLGYIIEIFPATYYKSAYIEDPEFITGFYMLDALLMGEFYKIPDYLYHLVLPVFCLSFVTLASIIRQTRSSMLETLQQDYVRTARAKGCDEKYVIRSYALRNSLLPTMTTIGLNFATLLSGAVLIEVTFNLRGIGILFIEATIRTDYWLMNACIIVLSSIYILTTIILDILYGIVDPRIVY